MPTHREKCERLNIKRGKPRTMANSTVLDVSGRMGITDGELLLHWIKAQGPVDWIVVTLTVAGKGIKNTTHLQKVLRQTLRRFECQVLGEHAVTRHQDRLLCVPVF